MALTISLTQQLLTIASVLVRTGKLQSDQILRLFFREAMYRFPHQAVFAVAAAWATLALVGRWEPERSWVDRLGRFFGLYWLTYPVLDWVMANMS
jgi:hypothetical protein